MPVIALKCPSCGASVNVDNSKDTAKCEFCGTPIVVKDDIVNNYVTNVSNIMADTVNVYSQKDFVIIAGVLKEYNGESRSVVIPQNVTEIDSECFSNKKIVSVVIPNGVRVIGDMAFKNCTALTQINIPDGMETIGSDAFAYCPLTSITIPDSVKKIGCDAFLHCEKLVDITLSDSLEELEGGLFESCVSLKKISFPSKVKYTGFDTFKDCSELSDVKFSSDLEYIDCSTFEGCSKLSEVIFPEGIKAIYARAFYGCLSLKRVFIPKSVECLGDEAFGDCKNIALVSFPFFEGKDKLKKIATLEGGFSGCENILRVVNSVNGKEIDYDYFNNSDYPLFSQTFAFRGTNWWEKVAEHRANFLRSQGRCLVCGGKFKGLFAVNCKECGLEKPSDYKTIKYDVRVPYDKKLIE